MLKKLHFSTLILAFFIPVSISQAQDMTGLCLDLGEEGCTDRFLPFDKMSISFCESSCTLRNPVPVQGIDATLYNMECVSDNPQSSGGRAIILRQIDRSSSSIKTYMIDSDAITPIVICP